MTDETVCPGCAKEIEALRAQVAALTVKIDAEQTAFADWRDLMLNDVKVAKVKVLREAADRFTDESVWRELCSMADEIEKEGK